MRVIALALFAASARANAPLARGDALAGLWPRRNGTAEGSTPLEITHDFRLTTAAQSPRLRRALDRYRDVILSQETLWPRKAAPEHTAPLTTIKVEVEDAEAPPRAGDDESFELALAPGGGSIRARTFSGAARALETLAQTTIKLGGMVLVNSTRTYIYDKGPLFVHRGINQRPGMARRASVPGCYISPTRAEESLPDARRGESISGCYLLDARRRRV